MRTNFHPQEAFFFASFSHLVAKLNYSSFESTRDSTFVQKIVHLLFF